MPQTANAISARNAKVEISTNGTAWTDISGYACSVDPDDSTRMSDENYTFDGDNAIITTGKHEPIDVKVKIIYTEATAEGFEVVRAAHEGNTNLHVRYSPKGGTTGNFQFTCAAGPVTKFKYPAVAADEAKAIMTEFTVRTPSIAKAALA